MSQFNDIVNGWKNVIFPNPLVEQKAIRRLAICIGTETTPRCSMATTKRIIRCRYCGCPISAKVRSFTLTNKCPIGKWPAEPLNTRIA